MVNQALLILLDMAGGETGIVKNVGAILGAAQAYLYLQQTQKAKQILKRVSEHPWTVSDAYYLEKCWFLLAEIYVSQNQADQVNRLMNNVLTRNHSSWKAYELMGQMREKENNYVDAAEMYYLAWDYGGRRNPGIGYKLAFIHFKLKRLFDCLEICDAVLARFPKYQRLRKDIQEKARHQIRP